MKIPKSFKLFGQTFEVVLDNDLHHRTDNVGEIKYRENKIYLQTNTKGFARVKEDIEQTFIHELIHAIFKSLGEDALGDNEKLVDTFVSLLHQALTTAEY